MWQYLRELVGRETMDLKQIAEALVAGCRTGREAENLDKLYAGGAVSVEAAVPPGMEREAHGLEAIRGKHAWWDENFEVHGGEVEGPFLHEPDRFAVTFKMDATHKKSGERSAMHEVGLYTVQDGKIVREEFFYSMG